MQYSYNLRKNFNWNGRFNAGHPSTRGNYTTPTPWNAGFAYSYGHTATRVSENLFRINQTHSASANMGIQPSENWKMDYNTRYNFQEGEFAEHVFTFSRILHCWRMQFQWTPVGAAEGWSFYIHITDLPDIKFQTASTKVNGDLR
jgi:hypothetical protein